MAGFILLVFVVAMVALIISLRRKRTRRVAAVGANASDQLRAFLQATGFSYPDSRGAPIDAQVARWTNEYERYQGAVPNVEFVRNYRGVDLVWTRSQTIEGRNRVYSQTWRALVQPRLLFHLSERTNGGRPGWQSAFPQQIGTGDPQLDSRFVVFSPHDPRAVHAILANPQVRQTLLSLAYVDLRVIPEGIVFSDPREQNLSKQLQQGSGAGALVVTSLNFEHSLPLHEQIAGLLLGTASLTC